MKITRKRPSRRSGSSPIGEKIKRKSKPRRMPRQKPGRSKQNYRTPKEFIRAIERRFGRITFDLAASETNTVCKRYYGKKKDSLKKAWPTKGNLWLNPPFGWLRPWIKKCAEHAPTMKTGSRILVLVPASIGSIWFDKYVIDKADVEGLRPRLTFVGIQWPYPKDLALLIFRPERFEIPAFTLISVWKWK